MCCLGCGMNGVKQVIERVGQVVALVIPDEHVQVGSFLDFTPEVRRSWLRRSNEQGRQVCREAAQPLVQVSNSVGGARADPCPDLYDYSCSVAASNSIDFSLS